MSWWVPPYEPSDHEIAVESLYGRQVDSGRRDAFPVERTLFICFTNRSGSNYLSAALASTGKVKPAREYLNHPMIERRSHRLGITHFDDYLRQIADEFGHNDTFTLKAGLRQLYHLAKLGFLDDLLPDPRFILITRDDVVAQAVSWVVASQTGQWTSNQERGDAELEYDFAAIHTRIGVLLEENVAFRAFLSRNGCETHFVRYEDMRARPGRTVKTLAEALGFESVQFRPGRVAIKSQHSPVNAEWKARYLEDVRSL